jgi:hypothetical protein
MSEKPPGLELAERVADVARGLGIETALIGALALAVHNYVRATQDADLATHVPLYDLMRLDEALTAAGLKTRLRKPDDEDDLGGVLRVWEHEDDDEEPIEPVEVVNFLNKLRPRRSPAREALARAVELDEARVRCVLLQDLIALKLDAGGRSDLADVVAVLRSNPGADLDAIRATCKSYGFDVIDTLIEEAKS